MGRPQKAGADYFPHDSNFRNDERVLAVRRKFGLEGYAVFVMLMEKAAQNIDTISDAETILSDAETSLKLELLAGEFCIEAEKLGQIIRYFLQLGLLETQGKNRLCVPYLTEKMQPLLTKRERNAGDYKKRVVSDAETMPNVEFQTLKPDISGVSDAETPVSDAESTQSKVKKSKETQKENIKRKKIAEQFERFWQAYPEKKAKQTAAQKFERILQQEGDITEVLLAAIAAQTEERKNLAANGSFVPIWKHPATWLNGRCWEDEPSKPSTSNTAPHDTSKKPSIGKISDIAGAFAHYEID